MSDVLTPLRQVYGLEPGASAPGDAGFSETRALQALREVLDAAPRPSPAPAVLDAVVARAAEPAPDVLPASPRESAALAVSLDALDRLPRPSPDVSVIAAIEARAAQASSALDAVRHVYADAPAPAGVEVDVLRQSREVIERSMTERPQVRPPSSVVDAVLARAAEAVGQQEVVPSESAVEAAVMAQSLQALDRLPRPQPSPAALGAILVAAATATAAVPAATLPVARPTAADRPAARPARRAPARRRTGLWAGASALLLAALVAVVLRPQVESGEPAVATVDAATTESASVDATQPAPLAAVAPEAESDETVSTPSAATVGTVTSGGAAFAALAPPARPAARPRTVNPRAQAVSSPAARASDAPPAAQPVTPAPSWDAPDDVRALSLRLQTLDDDALAWDEPAEAFGAPAPASVGATPGVQAVRAGAPARARVINTPVQR